MDVVSSDIFACSRYQAVSQSFGGGARSYSYGGYSISSISCTEPMNGTSPKARSLPEALTHSTDGVCCHEPPRHRLISDRKCPKVGDLGQSKQVKTWGQYLTLPKEANKGGIEDF